MNNNKNKNIRKIAVDGVKYTWAFVGHHEDYVGSFIKIWLDRKEIYKEFQKDVIVVTPKVISKIIKEKLVKSK